MTHPRQLLRMTRIRWSKHMAAVRYKGVWRVGANIWDGNGPHDAVHRDLAELQSPQPGAPLRAAAALQRLRSPTDGHRVRGGAEPQSLAGLLPKRSEPDQWETAGKIHICCSIIIIGDFSCVFYKNEPTGLQTYFLYVSFAYNFCVFGCSSWHTVVVTSYNGLASF